MNDSSIVRYHGVLEDCKCYCGHKDTQASYALWTDRLAVQDHQDLINRGWRRNGKYILKPALGQTCCPHFAIRWEVQDFKLNKSHRKVIKKVNRYLSTGLKPGESRGGADQQRSVQESNDYRSLEPLETVPERGCYTPTCDREPIGSLVKASATSQGNNLVTNWRAGKKENKTPKPGVGADPMRPACKKAKLKRLENRQQKQAQSKPKTKTGNESKSLESLLEDVTENSVHKLEVRLVRSSPPSDEFLSSYDEGYRIFKKYQMTVHKETENDCKETFYKDFLVESPLKEQQSQRDDGFQGFGSFHQLYVLDGKIIAVGILDILPRSVSSVYFYCDPDYAFLSLGTYSTLREIGFVRHLQTVEPGINCYYMGYYLHSCPKLNYKAQFYGSKLLCQETYLWYPMSHCISLLDVNEHTRFAKRGEVDEDGTIDLKKVKILHQGQAMSYSTYCTLNPEATDQEEVRKYASLVGNKLASRLLLHRSGTVKCEREPGHD